MTAVATTDQELRLFVPGVLWTINAERSMVHWEHRRKTEAIRKAALEAATDMAPFTGPVSVSAWPRTFTGKGDCGCHYGPVKAAVDGIVDAGVLPDDTREWVRCIIQYLPRKVAMKDQGLFLVIRPIEP